MMWFGRNSSIAKQSEVLIVTQCWTPESRERLTSSHGLLSSARWGSFSRYMCCPFYFVWNVCKWMNCKIWSRRLTERSPNATQLLLDVSLWGFMKDQKHLTSVSNASQGKRRMSTAIGTVSQRSLTNAWMTLEKRLMLLLQIAVQYWKPMKVNRCFCSWSLIQYKVGYHTVGHKRY